MGIKVAHFRPERMVHFHPELLAHFHPEKVAQFIRYLHTDGSTITKTMYAGSFVYEDTDNDAVDDFNLDFILNPEGKIDKLTSSVEYHYYLKDHLGNTRVLFDGDGTVKQKTDYYPFGMTSYQYSLSNDNKYLYNGKELQDEQLGGINLDWYDYGARFYDPALGRFHTVDPLAETYNFQSPFAYAANNPILYIDKNGEGPGLTAFIAIAQYRAKKWLGGMVSYTKQTSTNSGGYNSMNSIEAKSKGLGSQKMVSDISRIVAPVAEETDVAIGVGGEIKINEDVSIGIGGEIGTKGVKVYAEGPEGTVSGELSVTYDGEVDGNLSVAGETVLGNAPESEEGKISKTIGKGGYVRVETNPKNIAEKYKEKEGEIKRIKDSYTSTDIDEENYK